MRGANTVTTVQTLFEIVEFLTENDGTTITEVAASLGYAKSTVHRHLSTLKRLGHVVEDDNGHHVGLRFLHLGWHAQNRHPGYKLARDKVKEITERSANAPFTPIWDSVAGSRSTQPPPER